MEDYIREANRFGNISVKTHQSYLAPHSLVDDQDGLNNYAEASLTEQDKFKNHSQEWKSSLTIEHPSIQVDLRLTDF